MSLKQAGICYIVGAGPCGALDFEAGPEDYIIAADGGLRHLAAAGIRADMVVGDFDTLGKAPAHENIVRLQVIKDVTDTFVAMEKGIELGYRNFVFYGCLGGKLEHTMANLQHLAWLAERGMKGWMIEDAGGADDHMAEGRVITALKGPGMLSFAEVPDGESRIEAARREAAAEGREETSIQGTLGLVSVFAHTDQAEGVTLTGMKYPLTDASLTNGFPLGISNEFSGPASMIKVEKGILLVVLPMDALKRME